MTELLTNPLDLSLPWLQEWLARFNALPLADGADAHQAYLQTLRELSQANLAIIFHLNQENSWSITLIKAPVESEIPAKIESAITERCQQVHNLPADHPYRRIGFCFELPQPGDSSNRQTLLVIPLHPGRRQEFLVLAGLSIQTTLLSEVFARLVQVLFETSEAFLHAPPLNLEAHYLDELKLAYNYLPNQLYQRRLALFQSQLQLTQIFFQPIIYLDTEFMHIAGWEALARDPVTRQAPQALFAAAEVWGMRFIAELDRYFVLQATHSYREALARTSGLRRAEDIRELGVNVYPTSLTRLEYRQALEQILNTKVLPPEKLILEISEKQPVPHENESDSPAEALRLFRRHLEKLVFELGIGFAIDDFGIGYGSISRLIGLSPNYIKIDRNLLVSEHSQLTLRYVIDLLAKGRLQTAKVVVEGYQSDTQVSLKQLYDNKIRYIQGFLTGDAKPDLQRMDEDLKRALRAQLEI